MVNKFNRFIDVIFQPVYRNKVFFVLFVALIAGNACLVPLRFPHGGWTYYWEPALTGFSFAFLVAFIITTFVNLFNNKILKLIFKCMFYALGILSFIISLYLNFELNTYINYTTLTLLLQTNPSEASEFISQYILKRDNLVYVFIFVFLAIVVFFSEHNIISIKGIFKYPAIRKWIKAISGSLVLAFMIVGLFVVPLRMFDEIVNLRNPWAGDREMKYLYADSASNFLRTILFLKNIDRENSEWEDLNKTVLFYDIPSVASDSLKLVFVLGESHSKKHTSLYGYKRETMPNVSEEVERGNAFVFNDYIATIAYTSVAVRNMMSLNSLGDGEQWYEHVYWPMVMKRGGYNVELWDNQNSFEDDAIRNVWNMDLASVQTLKTFMDSCYTYLYVPKNDYDGQMLDVFMKKDINHASLIWIHLMGQHNDVDKRFPQRPEWMYFKNFEGIEDNKWINEDNIQIVNGYDNATRYVDFQLKRLIEKFRDDNAVIVYFSDHGEEIYDYRNVYGRQGNESATVNLVECLYEIPFIIWCSDKFITKHSEIITDIKNSINKPGMLDNVGQLMFHLGGMTEGNPFYIKRRDILSETYKCPPRITDRFDYKEFKH